MDKTDRGVPPKHVRVPEGIALKLHELIRRIDVVESTAFCVEEALLGRRQDPDRMLALCVEHNIADELSRISRSAVELMLELGHEPPEHAVRSPSLGMVVRPIREELKNSVKGGVVDRWSRS